MPLTVIILVLLFAVQSKGTALVASAFGPVMVVWFTVLAVLGIVHIADDPSVLDCAPGSAIETGPVTSLVCQVKNMRLEAPELLVVVIVTR